MTGTVPRESIFRKLCLLFAGLVFVNAAVILCLPEYRDTTVSVVERFYTPALSNGFNLRQLRDDDGVHPYTVFVPKHDDDQALPVILFLNGLGENGHDGVEPLKNGLGSRIRQTQGTFPFVSIFLQCHEAEGSWAESATARARVKEILNQLRSQLTLDESRIHLTGLSSGAHGVWHVGWAGGTDFASVFPIASTSPGIPLGTDLLQTSQHLPGTAMFFNRFDTDSVQQLHEETLTTLVRSGHDAILRDAGSSDLQDDSHNSWDVAFRAGSTYAWLARQSTKNRPPYCLLPGVSKSKESVSGTLATCFDDFELVFEVRPVEGKPICLTAVESAENRQEWTLRLARPQDGPSNFAAAGNHHRDACSVVAALSLRSHEWNTVRLHREKNDLQVFVNEWLLTRQTVTTNNWDIFLRNQNETEVRYVRGCGVEESNAIPSNETTEPGPEPCNYTLQEAIAAWKAGLPSEAPLSITWKLDREGDGRWSTFHAASIEQSSSEFSFSTRGNETEIHRPWNYVSSEFGVEGFERGVSRVDHRRWMDAFRDQRSAKSHGSRSHLVITDSLRTETICFGDSDLPSRQMITSSSGIEFGSGMPDELFCRIPQLIFQPFAKHGIRIPEESLVLDSHMKWANGERCCLLRSVNVDSNPSFQIYLSPEKSFRPVKCVVANELGMVDVARINYLAKTQNSTELSGWTFACTRASDPFAKKRYPGWQNVIHFGIATEVTENTQAKSMPVDRERIVCNRTSRTWVKVSADGSEVPMSSEEVRDLQDRDAQLQVSRHLFDPVQIVIAVIIIGTILLALRTSRVRVRSDEGS